MFGYLGPEGTFTHQALLQLVGNQPARSFSSVAACLDAADRGDVGAALVPIENSVEGGVSATLDYLARPGAPVSEQLTIVSEVLVNVSFDLFVRPDFAAQRALADVKTVVTHPHAAAQVREWLARNVPNAEIHEIGSTAGGALEVSNPESRFDSAICATIAGEMYGLVPLAQGIADNAQAVTRFVLVAKGATPPPRTGHDKTTFVAYMRADHSGALGEILEQLAVRGVNLCRIESRPTKTALGNYCFSMDAEGHIFDARLGAALMGLKRICQHVVFLGSYPRADGVQPTVPYGGSDADYAAASSWLGEIRGDH